MRRSEEGIATLAVMIGSLFAMVFWIQTCQIVRSLFQLSIRFDSDYLGHVTPNEYISIIQNFGFHRNSMSICRVVRVLAIVV